MANDEKEIIMRVSFYKNTFGKKQKDVDFEKAIQPIKDLVWLKHITKLRQIRAVDKDKYDKAKEKTICFTPSGVFKQSYSTKKAGAICPVMIKDCIEYNPIVIVDFDYLNEFQLETVWDKIKDDPHTHVAFMSPSGAGYKVFVRVATAKEDHKKSFKAVNEYYHQLTGVKPDPSGSNINRLCYISADSSLVYNPQSKIYTYQTELFPTSSQGVANKKSVEFQPKPIDTSLAALLRKLEDKMSRDGHAYVKGSRHDYIKHFCINAVKYGIGADDCANTCLERFGDKEASEIANIVSWAYDNVKEVGVYVEHQQQQLKQYAQQRERALTTNDNTAPQEAAPSESYKAVLFKEYSDEHEVHTSTGLKGKQIKEFKEDFQKLLDYVQTEIDVRDSKTARKIANTIYLEILLKEDFDFRHNIMTGHFEFKAKSAKKYSLLEDSAYNSLHRYMMYQKGRLITPATIKKSVESEFSPKVHPMRELMKNWGEMVQGDDRDYIDEVASLVKTDAPKGLWKSVFKKWVVASVANVFVDNYCTNRYCPILVGGQSTGKTKFFKSLWPHEYPEYFYCGTIDVKNKDSILRLIDTFLIIIDEQIASIEGDKEWDYLKGLVSKDRVKSRRVFAKGDTTAPRMANMAGSCNGDDLLEDPTGNSRFLPFRVMEHIDLNAFKDLDMMKFWGQAYQLHKQSQNDEYYYLLSDKEKREIEEYQKQFKKHGVEHELILDDWEAGNSQNYHATLTTVELTKMYQDKYPRLNITPKQIGSALKLLGFQRKRITREDGNRKDVWFLLNAEDDFMTNENEAAA